MATGKIIQEIAVKVTGTDDLKAAEKLIGKVDGTKAKATVDIDTKGAQRSVDEFIEDLKGLDAGNYTVALGLKDAQLQKQLGELLDQITKLDAQDITIDAKMEQANQIAGDIDKIESKIKEVNDTPIDLNTKSAKQGLDEVSKSAGSSKSVLANMIGNSVQDLGALGGVAGTAGVAIGQMGEYMADAAGEGEKLGSVLGNFAKVAGPLALVAVATQAVNAAVSLHAKEAKHDADVAKVHAEAIKAETKAMEAGKGAATGYLDHLKEIGKIQATLSGSHLLPVSVDAADALLRAGESAITFAQAINGTDQNMAAFIARVRASNATVADQNLILLAASQAHEDHGKAVEEDARHNALFVDGQKEAARRMLAAEPIVDQYNKQAADGAAAMEELARKEELHNKALQDEAKFTEAASKRAEEHAADVDRVGQQYADALDAQTSFQNAMKGADWGHAAVAGGVTAMQGYSAQLNSLVNIAADAEAAQDSFTESIKQNGFTFDVATEKGRANQQALEDLGQAIDVKLGAAYASANGNQEAFIDSATKLGEDTLQKLAKQMHLNKDQTDKLRTSLGLTATDYEARFKLAGDEEARIKLGLLQSAIDKIDDEEVTATITQQIIAGDYQGAVATAQNYFTSHPVAQPVKVHSPSADELNEVTQKTNAYLAGHPAKQPVQLIPVRGVFSEGGTVGPDGGIAGEAGAEIVTSPHGRQAIVSGATPVTQGTVVTSTNETARILAALGAGGSTTVNNNTVNVYVPQGYRERDAVEAAYRSTIRSGRLYASL